MSRLLKIQIKIWIVHFRWFRYWFGGVTILTWSHLPNIRQSRQTYELYIIQMTPVLVWWCRYFTPVTCPWSQEIQIKTWIVHFRLFRYWFGSITIFTWSLVPNIRQSRQRWIVHLRWLRYWFGGIAIFPRLPSMITGVPDKDMNCIFQMILVLVWWCRYPPPPPGHLSVI